MPSRPSRVDSPSDSESEDEHGFTDIDTDDPEQLKKIIRDMQSQRNSETVASRRSFGDDLTNAGSKRRRHGHASSASHKRPHNMSSTPADGRSDSESESEPAEAPPPTTQRSDADDAEYIRAGRHWGIQRGLWLVGSKHLFDTRLDLHYDVSNLNRFEPDMLSHKIQAQLHEIADYVPTSRRGLLSAATDAGTEFRLSIGSLVQAGVRSQRSNTATRARKVAGPAIFNVGPTDLNTSERRLNTFKEDIGWFVEDGEADYHPLNVPILHGNLSSTYDLNHFLLNPVPMRMYAALARGPDAAAHMLDRDLGKVPPNAPFPPPASETMREIFKLDHVDIGGIASAAVLTIWALSADGKLQPVGFKTGIRYEDLHDEYMQILATGLSTNPQSDAVKNIVKVWNEKIYPEGRYDGGGGRGCRRRRNAAALDALRAEAVARQAV